MPCTRIMGKDLSVFTAEVVDQVFARDHGCCAKCGRQWDRDYGRGQLGGWDMQHRMARGKGGSKKNAAVGDVSAAIILCRTCHHDIEVKHRVDAFAQGFAVSRIGIRQPWEVPIKHAVHGWCLLTRSGGVEKCDPPEKEAA